LRRGEKKGGKKNEGEKEKGGRVPSRTIIIISISVNCLVNERRGKGGEGKKKKRREKKKTGVFLLDLSLPQFRGEKKGKRLRGGGRERVFSTLVPGSKKGRETFERGKKGATRAYHSLFHLTSIR